MSAHLKHILIVALIAASVLAISWKLFARMDGTAHDQVILAQQTLKEDLDKAKIQASATKADNTALQAQLNALQASNAALTKTLATLQAQLANQRQADAAMPPDALSLRWSDIIGKPEGVQVSPAGFNVTLAAGHETVSQLEEIPVLKAEKAQIEANSAKKDDTLSQAQKTLGSTAAELETCKNHTVPDTQAKCDREKTEIKASNRKRNLVITVLAAIGGFLLRSKI